MLYKVELHADAFSLSWDMHGDTPLEAIGRAAEMVGKVYGGTLTLAQIHTLKAIPSVDAASPALPSDDASDAPPTRD